MDGKIISNQGSFNSDFIIAIAAFSLAIQLADGCIKLYHFWNSIRDAPEDVAIIMDDLLLLSTVLRDISHDKEQAPAVILGLECCKTKILVSPNTCNWHSKPAEVFSRSSMAL